LFKQNQAFSFVQTKPSLFICSNETAQTDNKMLKFAKAGSSEKENGNLEQANAGAKEKKGREKNKKRKKKNKGFNIF